LGGAGNVIETVIATSLCGVSSTAARSRLPVRARQLNALASTLAAAPRAITHIFG